jgi:tRNA G18 (ribose-2'-O)-methylase SpoU
MAQLITIEEFDDPRIDAYRNVRDRDLKQAHGGRFVAEGLVVVRALAESRRIAMESLFLSQAKAESLGDFLGRLPKEIPAYVGAQPLMDRIVGFPLHRGVLAVGSRPPPAPLERLVDPLAAQPRALALGLVGIANHDNVGSLFRNAAAFGADAVLLDHTSCDPLYRKALRVSVGAALHVPFHWGADARAMIERLRSADFAIYALSPGGSLTLAEAKRAPRTALLFGAEGPGLPPDLLASTQTLRIPMQAGFDSLNVATAAGIALYTLTRTDRE